MKTTEQVIDSINEVIEKPVIGCPTIHYPKQKVKEDFYDEEVFDAERIAEEIYLSFQASRGYINESNSINQSDLDSLLEEPPSEILGDIRQSQLIADLTISNEGVITGTVTYRNYRC